MTNNSVLSFNNNLLSPIYRSEKIGTLTHRLKSHRRGAHKVKVKVLLGYIPN